MLWLECIVYSRYVGEVLPIHVLYMTRERGHVSSLGLVSKCGAIYSLRFRLTVVPVAHF